MTEREALKLALEALNTPRPSDSYPPLWRAYETTINSAIKACEEALAQPEQKPYAWADAGSNRCSRNFRLDWIGPIPLYTAPPQRKPEQKPVAWGMPNASGDILDVISPEEHGRLEGGYTVPLYTSHEAAHGIKDEQ